MTTADTRKLVLVTRKTRLESLVERLGTLGQARFYVEHAGADFADYVNEHDTYRRTLDLLRNELRPLGRLHEVERSFLPSFLFGESDLVVTAGQDGLVVNTAKYLSGQPILAVNPDPARFDGVLLPFLATDAAEALTRLLAGKARLARITMAEARLGDGQRLLAFNDLFVGARSHVSARYVIAFGERRETHSSSGLIVATGAGSTGWLSSLYNMAFGMLPLLRAERAEAEPDPRFPWDAEKLRFVVREPFRSRASEVDLVFGEIGPGGELKIESRMAEEGVIFSDGVEADYLAFNAGAIASVGIAERKALLVRNG